MTTGRVVACPSCGGTVAVRAAGYTVTLACRYCGALLDVASPDVQLIAQYTEAVARLTLPLGSRGTLDGVAWEVIGWLERQVEEASWEEYLLFNPYAGYRWLVHGEGQWQLGTMLVDRPQPQPGDQIGWGEQLYAIEGPSVTITTARVLGEFYWRVKAGDVVDAASYARGNETLSVERSADEITWTHLVGVSAGDITGAFRPPAHAGDGPAGGSSRAPCAGAAPSGGKLGGLVAWWSDLPGMLEDDLLSMFVMAGVSLVLVLLANTYLGAPTQSLTNKLRVAVDGPTSNATLGTITVSRPAQAVRITATADDGFANQWVDLDYALVDRHTQRAIHAAQTLEYYAGVDTDGSRWSEGSQTISVPIASVPRGSYDVVVEAQAHHWSDPKAAADGGGLASTQPTSGNPWTDAPGSTDATGLVALTIEADVGTVDWRVFATLLALLLTPPLVILIWRRWQG